MQTSIWQKVSNPSNSMTWSAPTTASTYLPSRSIGPNAMTYLLAGELFPTSIRGMGAGFAASFAKIGAVVTSFLFPILLKDLGTATLLYILVGTSLLGAFITWRFGVETKGLNLETIGADRR